MNLRSGPGKRPAPAPPERRPAGGRRHRAPQPRGGNRFWRWLAGLIGLAVVAAVAAAALLASGLWDGPLQRLANDTLLGMVPPQMAMRLGETEVRLTRSAALAVSYLDVELSDRQTGETIARARRLAVVIDPLSVLAGAPAVAGIEAVGLRVHAGRVASLFPGGTADAPVIGLSDIGRYHGALFDRLRRWGAVHLYRAGGLHLRLRDAAVLGGADGTATMAAIDWLSAQADGAGTATIAGALSVSGAAATLEANVRVPAAGAVSQPAELTASIDGLPFPWRRLPTLFSNVPADHQPDAERPPVPALWRLDARQAGAGQTGNRLTIAMTPKDLSLKLAEGDFVPFAGTARFDYSFEDATVALVPDRWKLGRTVFEMSGGFRDADSDDNASAGLPKSIVAPIEFDLIANDGRLSPIDSPERPVRFAAKALGVVDPAAALIRFTDMRMQSDQGGATAEGQMALGGEAPTAVFDVSVDDVSTAGLKQFWPAAVARGARRWVLDNIAGGRVTTGRFQIVEPLRRRDPRTGARISGDTHIVLDVEGVRFDTAGDLPPVRNATAEIRVAGQTATVALRSGTVYLPSGRTAQASDGLLIIDGAAGEPRRRATLSADIAGDAAAVGELISYHPIDAQRHFSFSPNDLSGKIKAHVELDWMLGATPSDKPPVWSVDLTMTDGASVAPIDGHAISSADGTVNVTPQRVVIDLDARIDGVPAQIAMTLPLADPSIAAERHIELVLDDPARARLAPGLQSIVSGPTPVSVEMGDGPMRVRADLSDATLSLPWVGWTKGPGIGAVATFKLRNDDGKMELTDFDLAGSSFGARGRIEVSGGVLVRARFDRVRLNGDDDIAVDVERQGAGYSIEISGASFDARALLRMLRNAASAAGGTRPAVPLTISARIGRVTGFGGEVMGDLRVRMERDANGLASLSISGQGASGMPFSFTLEGQGAERRVRLEALDAGEFLRFVDLYGQVRGGVLNASAQGESGGTLSGTVRVTDFFVVNEPRLVQLVSGRPAADRQSLHEAVRRQIDTGQVRFDLAQGKLNVSDQAIRLSEGVARGPLVGFSLQGLLADKQGQMRLTGTFMPAYGLNSLFADIPLVGVLLGNGLDRGLIGVTFLLEGSFDRPQVTVNPLSLIAPGVFRSIFEFR